MKFSSSARAALHPGRSAPVLQSETAECGLACLAMLAAWHGKRVDLHYLRTITQVSSHGMTLRHLMRTAETLQMSARAIRVELDDLRNVRLPCVLHWSFNHYVVLYRIGKTSAVINDPAVGRRTVTREEVSNHFTGIVLEAWPCATFTAETQRSTINLRDLLRGMVGIRGALVRILIVSACIETLTLCIPLATQFVVDVAFNSGDMTTLHTVIAAVFILLGLRAMLGIARAGTLVAIKSALSLHWSEGFFNQILRLPLAYFEKRHAGDIASRHTSLNEIQEALTAEMLGSILDGIIVVALIVLMFAHSLMLAMISLTFVACYTGAKYFFYGSLQAAKLEAINYEARQSSHFLETIRGVACIKIFGLEGSRRTYWINSVVNAAHARGRVFRFQLLHQAFAALLTGLSAGTVLLFGGHLVENQVLTVGAFFALMLYADMFMQRAVGAIDTLFNLKLVSLHLERVTDVVVAKPEPCLTPDYPTPIVTEAGHDGASVHIRNVHYRYAPDEPDILHGVTLDIRPSENLAVVGASGCGKSTLLRIIGGLATPYSGEVCIDGVPLSQLGLENYRRRIAFVMQDDKLFAGSLSENICCFDPQPDWDWMQQCAQAASIHNEIVKFPGGYNTMVGDMGSVLSGGQKQRVALARALYKRPSILLLDEATSNLDDNNEQKINEALKRLRMTRIFVAHREKTILSADRVFNLETNTIEVQNASAMQPPAG